MTTVPSTSIAPLLAGGISPSAAEAPPAGEAGSTRTAAVAGAKGDAVVAAASGKGGASKASKTVKTTGAKKKTTSGKAKAGYASGGSVPKDLAFLRDPKLSVEEKLIRFLAYMNEKADAEITRKMEEIGGGTAAKSTGSAGGASGAAKPKGKKGFWGTLLDAAKVALPGVGLTLQVLKNPKTKAMLKDLGGPVLGAAAAALGFPQVAPLLAKLGPQIVDYAAAGVQAVEKAAAAEEKAAAGGSSSSASGTGASGTSTGGSRSEQLQMMELQRTMEKQQQMFSLVSNMLKSMHDTKSHIIGNLR